MTLRVRHRRLQKQGCASSLASSTKVRRGTWCHVIQLRGSTEARFTAQPRTARLEDTMVASEALRNQVSSKWKDYFNVSTAGQWVTLGSWSSGRCAVQCRLFSKVQYVQRYALGLGRFFRVPAPAGSGGTTNGFQCLYAWVRMCVSVDHLSWLQIPMN